MNCKICENSIGGPTDLAFVEDHLVDIHDVCLHLYRLDYFEADDDVWVGGTLHNFALEVSLEDMVAFWFLGLPEYTHVGKWSLVGKIAEAYDIADQKICFAGVREYPFNEDISAVVNKFLKCGRIKGFVKGRAYAYRYVPEVVA